MNRWQRAARRLAKNFRCVATFVVLGSCAKEVQLPPSAADSLKSKPSNTSRAQSPLIEWVPGEHATKIHGEWGIGDLPLDHPAGSGEFVRLNLTPNSYQFFQDSYRLGSIGAEWNIGSDAGEPGWIRFDFAKNTQFRFDEGTDTLRMRTAGGATRVLARIPPQM